MIELVNKPFTDEESLAVLNKYVSSWFTKNFTELTPPQKFAFKLISEKKNVLITAPTGSGKTMSAFTTIISKLFDYSLEGKLEDKVYCLYISPLKSLNNDVHRNLSKPLDEVFDEIIKSKGVKIMKESIRKVTIGVRTGDTLPSERQKMLKTPPNILVTTPESLAILLNSSKFVENLKSVEYVIIDEVHELANNKRGVHLALSIERLADITATKFTRVGLGATLHPLEEAAKYVVGYDGSKPNDCIIVDASWSKKLDVKTISPVSDMIYTDDKKVEEATYDLLDKTIKNGNTTLVFTNTRSGTERVIFNLKKRFGYGDDIAAHHGSLSRESRLEVEEMLKKGSLKCAVSSTSLELGVDVGSIDTVVQLGSPKSVTRAVQRIGRAGHSFKATAKGDVIVLNRDDLVECTIMLDAALKKHLDSFSVPRGPLDVLAQHIVGMSLSKKWTIDEAYNLVRRAYSYSDLSKNDFMALINYLAGNYVGLESRRVYGKIWYDEKEQTFGKRGYNTKIIYMLNLGTIPDQVACEVIVASTKKSVGSIEEEFLMKLKDDDIFTLGGKLYKFDYAKVMKCYVSTADATAPTIPPWYSEQLPLSYELANEIGSFRLEFSKVLESYISKNKIKKFMKSKELPKEAEEFLSKLPADENSKKALFGYFMEQLLFTKYIPNKDLLVVEFTGDISSYKFYVIFHSLYGRRVNDALSRAIAIEIGDRLDMDIGVMVNDNGFMFIFDEKPDIDGKIVNEVLSTLSRGSLIPLMKKNVRKTEMMRRRFRHAAARSFMILRNYKGFKIGVGRQQVNSQIILKAVEEMDQNFPILKEAYREILNDVMDLPRAEEVLSKIRNGEVKCKFLETPFPSPFAHNLITFGHSDVIMMKDRHEYLRELHKLVMKNISAK